MTSHPQATGDIRRRHDDYDPRKLRRTGIALLITIALALVALAFALMTPATAHAAPRKAAIKIPTVSTLYRLKIEREASRNFGLDAPIARLAAQIHQESAWNPRAASPYAQGLTQFTPATARWLPTVCPAVGPPDVWDPDWSLRAQACYMAWLHTRVAPFKYAGVMDACTRWNFALRAYNGGEGWLKRERLRAQSAGADANAWAQVERYRVRAGWAHRENVHYPRRIMLELEPAYLNAGWPGVAVCT